MSGRIGALDTVRGVALVGIIAGNVMWFSGYAVSSDAAHAALGTETIDAVAVFLVHWLVDGKFYALFSLLFGVGFALLVRRAQQQGARVSHVLARRIAALGVLGGLHAMLLWFGDIISLYAVCAIPLVFVRGWSSRRLLVLSVLCLVEPVVVGLGQWILAEPEALASDMGHGPASLLPAFADGTYVEALSANAAFVGQRWVLALYSSRFVRIFGFFTLGLVVARSLPSLDVRVPGWLWPVAVLFNLALALLAGVPLHPPSALGMLYECVYSVAVPSGCLLYAALAWRWATRQGWLARMLAAAGRLSLTHYIMQSLVMAAVGYGWGLGAWGHVGAAGAVAAALLLVGLQCAVSPIWLRRYGPGPLERLLRAATRGYRSA